MEKFIYVFNKEARDALLAAGFELFKSDDGAGAYCFLNQPDQNFALRNVSYIATSVLTF